MEAEIVYVMFMKEKDGTMKPLSITESEEYAKEFASSGKYFGYLVANYQHEIFDSGSAYQNNSYEQTVIESEKIKNSKIKPFEVIKLL